MVVMRRRMLFILAALSLALCGVSLAWWGRSLWRFDAYSTDVAGTSVSLSVPRHAIRLGWFSRPGYYYFNTRGWSTSSPHPHESVRDLFRFEVRRPKPGTRGPDRWRGLGFEYQPLWRDWAGSSRAVEVPFWSLAGATAVLPLRRARAAWRSRRTRQGTCGRCGYDLRASPERCPECGTDVAAQPAA